MKIAWSFNSSVDCALILCLENSLYRNANLIISALFLAMGGLFITIAFKRDKPHLLLLAHPVLLFSLAALASFYLDTETLDLSVLVDFWRQILDSDYSSLPEIMAFSAVPTWCALAFTSSVPFIPEQTKSKVE